MSQPAEPADDGDDDGVFTECLREGEAQFTLAMASNEAGELSEREKMLVDVAIAAGCVGTLTVVSRD